MDILDNLKPLELNQAKIARILKRKHRQEIWLAIHTDRYPLLKQRIITLIQKRKDKLVKKASL